MLNLAAHAFSILPASESVFMRFRGPQAQNGQIWTALIVLPLLKWLHHLSQAGWSLSNLASMLRLNLFTYRDLTQWLANPMETPPLLPAAEQLTLALM